jgi:hypothetical protein
MKGTPKSVNFSTDEGEENLGKLLYRLEKSESHHWDLERMLVTDAPQPALCVLGTTAAGKPCFLIRSETYTLFNRSYKELH